MHLPAMSVVCGVELKPFQNPTVKLNMVKVDD